MAIFQKIKAGEPQKHGNVTVGGPKTPLYGDSTFRYETTNNNWYNENTKETILEYNVPVTADGAEASLALPGGTRRIQFQARGTNAVRWGFTEGNPGDETSPYSTLKASEVYEQEYPDGLFDTTIYFSADSNDVIEVICQL